MQCHRLRARFCPKCLAYMSSFIYSQVNEYMLLVPPILQKREQEDRDCNLPGVQPGLSRRQSGNTVHALNCSPPLKSTSSFQPCSPFQCELTTWFSRESHSDLFSHLILSSYMGTIYYSTVRMTKFLSHEPYSSHRIKPIFFSRLLKTWFTDLVVTPAKTLSLLCQVKTLTNFGAITM